MTPMDEIDELVDQQLAAGPSETGWTCPPNGVTAAVFEHCFWEAMLKCALDEAVPIKLAMRNDQDRGSGIELPNPVPPQLWQYMAEAHANPS